MNPRPFDRELVVRSRVLESNVQVPVVFRLERFDLVESIDAERKRRCLTRSIRHKATVQVTVFALEISGLVAGEGASDAQVDFLSSVDGERFVLVRQCQVVHRAFYVRVGNRTESGSQILALDTKN